MVPRGIAGTEAAGRKNRIIMTVEDVLIIGAGPAGIAAAVQMKRSELDPLILEKDVVGGLLKNANVVENYPGFPKGIPGADLVHRLQGHIKEQDIRIRREEVLRLEPAGDRIRVTTSEGIFEARAVLAASGTVGKTPPDFGIPPRATGARVFDEIHPLLSARNRRMLIIGAGDAAFDYALTLSRHNVVLIFNRGVRCRCLPLLRRRAASRKGIEYLENTRVVRMVSLDQSGMVMACESSGKNWQVKVDYVIFAIGREANLKFLSPDLRDHSAEIETGERLFFAGDVQNGRFRQAAIAAGEGLLAGMKISNLLRGAP
jgi:thioredoxin reductase